jgi:hypothetical protein
MTRVSDRGRSPVCATVSAAHKSIPPPATRCPRARCGALPPADNLGSFGSDPSGLNCLPSPVERVDVTRARCLAAGPGSLTSIRVGR